MCVGRRLVVFRFHKMAEPLRLVSFDEFDARFSTFSISDVISQPD